MKSYRTLKVLGWVFLCIFGLPRLLAAQVTLQVTGDWSVVPASGIRDAGVGSPGGVAYASDWLRSETGAPGVGVRLGIDLPMHLRAMVGYHAVRFHEAPSSDSALIYEIYGIAMVPGLLRLDSFEGSSTSQGFDFGLMFAPPVPWSRVRPFARLGVRGERLRSTTRVRGSGTDADLAVSGDSELKTKAAWGSSVAVGVEVPIRRYAIVASVERNQAAPSVAHREALWAAHFGDGRDLSWDMVPDVPSGQVIDLTYYVVQVAVQATIF